MEKRERLDFIKITEKMVSPRKVATTFQGAELLRRLPRVVQKKLMENGAKTEPYIGFVVEPYSLFLAYEVLDEARLASMLPASYELVDSAMFQDSKARKCVIIGAFNVHASFFWGNRVELYIIARNRQTGFLTWIIHEYETNTISFDPGRGFVEPTTHHSVLTTSCLGEVILEVEGKDSARKIQVTADARKGECKKLSRELWIEGNLSVDYGRELSDVQTKPFGLIFDPAEMNEALSIPLKHVEIVENTLFPGIIGKEPFEVCCFQYAQHFYTTSIPMGHAIRNESDLEKEIVAINRRGVLGGSSAKAPKRTLVQRLSAKKK